METNKRRELVPVSDAVMDEEELASPGALAVKRVKGWGGGMASDRKGKGPLDIGKIEELKVPGKPLPTSAPVSSSSLISPSAPVSSSSLISPPFPNPRFPPHVAHSNHSLSSFLHSRTWRYMICAHEM
jgi:hypothetical protein